MKNTRPLKLLFFMLVLPITLYISLHSSHTKKSPPPPPPPPPPLELVATSSPTSSPTPFFTIEHWVLLNGARVYFVPTQGLPFVDIEITFDAGSARDNDKFGLALLSANLLDQGTLNLNADDIASQFEDAGALFKMNVGRDKASLSLRSLTNPSFLNPVIELLSNVLNNPSFPEKAIELQRSEILIDIKQKQQQPGEIARNAFYKALYQNHPYAHPVAGTLDSVAAIKKIDLIQFYQQYYVANNANITLVGDINKEQAMLLAEKILGKLPNGEKPAPLPDVTPLVTGFDIRLPFPGEQTHILMGEPCIIAGDPDRFPLLVGNEIFGSNNMTSLLFKEIRNDRGLVYSITSTLHRFRKPAPFVISMQTENSQAERAITITRKTLADFIEKGPTETELRTAKNALISSLPNYINTNQQITLLVSDLAFYDQPLNWVNTYQERIEAVSIDNIKTAFQNRIHPDKLGLIVVGTKEP